MTQQQTVILGSARSDSPHTLLASDTLRFDQFLGGDHVLGPPGEIQILIGNAILPGHQSAVRRKTLESGRRE